MTAQRAPTRDEYLALLTAKSAREGVDYTASHLASLKSPTNPQVITLTKRQELDIKEESALFSPIFKGATASDVLGSKDFYNGLESYFKTSKQEGNLVSEAKNTALQKELNNLKVLSKNFPDKPLGKITDDTTLEALKKNSGAILTVVGLGIAIVFLS